VIIKLAFPTLYGTAFKNKFRVTRLLKREAMTAIATGRKLQGPRVQRPTKTTGAKNFTLDPLQTGTVSIVPMYAAIPRAIIGRSLGAGKTEVTQNPNPTPRRNMPAS